MINVTFEEFKNVKFELFENNPIIKRFGSSTVVADPSVIPPEKSGDGKWHLFCHTFYGVYRFESNDGINFINKGRVVKNAMRPDINVIDGVYYLYYERVQPLIKRGLAAIRKAKWFSEIYLIKSKDLENWTKPEKVVGYDKTYQAFDKGVSVSNPFLLKKDGKYVMYFSAGLTFLEDCNFSEPTFIARAESDMPDKLFVADEVPILKPDRANKRMNRCCGCIKVYELLDCYIGLQNGIYMDENGNSHSVIALLKSDDGKKFEYVKPLISPIKCGENEWMAQYVYACSLVESGRKLWIYFNARNEASIRKGRENIGVAIAEIPIKAPQNEDNNE